MWTARSKLKNFMCAADFRVFIKSLFVLDGVFKGKGGEGHSVGAPLNFNS